MVGSDQGPGGQKLPVLTKKGKSEEIPVFLCIGCPLLRAGLLEASSVA